MFSQVRAQPPPQQQQQQQPLYSGPAAQAPDVLRHVPLTIKGGLPIALQIPQPAVPTFALDRNAMLLHTGERVETVRVRGSAPIPRCLPSPTASPPSSLHTPTLSPGCAAAGAAPGEPAGVVQGAGGGARAAQGGLRGGLGEAAGRGRGAAAGRRGGAAGGGGGRQAQGGGGGQAQGRGGGGAQGGRGGAQAAVELQRVHRGERRLCGSVRRVQLRARHARASGQEVDLRHVHVGQRLPGRGERQQGGVRAVRQQAGRGWGRRGRRRLYEGRRRGVELPRVQQQ